MKRDRRPGSVARLHLAQQRGDQNRGMHDLGLVAEPAVVVAERFQAMRARRQNLLHVARLECLHVLVGQLLKHVLVAGALRGIAVAGFFLQHTERDAAGTKNVEERAQRLLVVGLERARASEPHQPFVTRGIEDLDAGGLDEFLPLLVAQAPDVPPPLEIVVHAYQDTRARRRSRPARAARRRSAERARCRPGTGSRRRRRWCTARGPARCRSRRASSSRRPASRAS